MPLEPPSAPPTARTLVPVRIASALVVVALAWAAWAAVTSRQALLEAQAVVSAAAEGDSGPGGTIDAASVRRDLARAATLADRADMRMHQLGPRLLTGVPVLGTVLAAEADVARAASIGLQTGVDALGALDRVESEGGRVDLAALRDLRTSLDRGTARLLAPRAQLAERAVWLLPPPAARPVRLAQKQLAGLADALRSASTGVGAATGLLGGDGPRTIVLGVMNNAELRGAGGYVSSFAVVTSRDGRVDVSSFQDVNDVQDPPEDVVRVPAAPDFARRWNPYLADTTLWKNVAMSAHVPDSAQVLCGVARLRPGVPCDGVVLLDVPALAEVMALVGPVRIGDEQVSRDELVKALLVEAYADVPDTSDDQADRRARLRAAADSALSDLLGKRLAGPSALRVLVRAAQGRHLSVWSADEGEQRALVEVGLSGSVDPGGRDLSLTSLNQLSAGKLDYYLDREVEVDVVVSREEAQVVQRTTLTLDAPPDLPRYVVGTKQGALDELVDLAVAEGAQDLVVRRDGSPVAHQLVRDTGSLRVSTILSLRAGQRVTYEVRYRLPLRDARYALALRPQPLANDAALRLDVRAARGFRLTDVEGDLQVDGELDRSRDVAVRVEEASWLDRPFRFPWQD